MLPAGFSRFPTWRRWFGRRSERAAARFLRRQGMRILGQNLDDRRGEIDILALDDNCLVVVEVRSSESRSHNELAGTVGDEKQRRLSSALLRFLQRRQLWDVAVRFDILTIRWPVGSRRPDVQQYRNAFEMTGRHQFRG